MATADNLKIAQQLLATMQQITVQVERQTEAYHAQAQLVDALCKAQECFGKIDAAKVKEVTDALKEAQEKTKEFGNEISDVAEKEVSKLEGALRKIAEKVKEISVPAEFANGFKAGLTLSTNLFKNILSLGGSAFGLLKDIGGIFLSLPGRLMDFFQGAAGSGSDPYRQALEDLREEFGDLSVGTSAAVKNMTESTKSLGESGLRLSRVFGYGREGLANMLKENMEMFKQMGPLANRLAASLRGAEGEFTLLRKATGLTGEAMKAFQLRAEETGMSGAQATREMTLALAQGQRAFGISVKEFGKDMEVMLKDTITFGIKAPAEMVKVSAYVKKLGISMETLKKVTDKAFNFEDAAQQAAKLSEAFGIALDPLKQMEADPVKKMDNLRQAFFKTGRSYESMSAQARKYLADQAGISDEEARIAFSQKNRAMTGAQVEAQMKKQQKAQMSQAEAMKILAESVKRLVQSGSAMKGSFFDVFAKGFESGIRRTKEFREVTRKLQQSMRTVYWAGRDVGRMFVKEFPGIKEMFKGLADMFNPRRFRELMKQVKEEFSKFFKALQTDPKAGVQEFMKNMKKIFFDFFTKGAPAGSRFLDGLKAFYKTVGAIFVEGLRYALDGLKNVLGIVIGFIRDPSSLKRMATDTGEGLKGMFVQAFSYLVKELGPVLQVIGGQIVELMKLLFEKYIKPHLMKLVMLIFGPALFMGIARAAGAAVLKVGFEKIITGFVDRIPKPPAPPTTPGGGPPGAPGTNPVADMKNFGLNMIKLAGAMAVVAVAVKMLMPIILSIARDIENSGLSKESIAFTAVLLGIFGALFIALGSMIKTVSEADINSSKVTKAIGVMALAGLVLVALVPIASFAITQLGKFTAEEIAKTVFVMTAFSLLFAGLSLLIFGMALASPGITAGFGPAAAALFAAGVLLALLVPFSKWLIKSMGEVDIKKAENTMLILGGFSLLLGAVALLFVGLAALGGMITASAGTAIGAAALGTVAAFAVLALMVPFSQWLIGELGGISKDKIEATFTIMDSITELFVVITGMITLLAFAASKLSIAAIAKMTFLLYKVKDTMSVLAEAAKTMIRDLGTINIDESKAKAGAAVMSAVGNLIKDVASVVATLALAGRASIMGAILGFDFSNSYGKIKDMLIGRNGLLNTIKTIVNEMITTVSGIQGDPASLQAKAGVFTEITKGIGALLPPIGRLVETLASTGSNSLLGIIIGADASNFVANFDKIKTFVEGFLNGIFKGPDGIVPKIIESFSGLNPAQVEGVKAGASLLGSFVPAFAEMTKTLPEMIRAVTGLVDELDTEGQISSVLLDIQILITNIVGSMSRMLTSVISSIGTLLSNSAITPEKLKGAEAIGNILKSVTELAKVFTLSPEQLRVFANTSGFLRETRTVNVAGMGTYLSSITTQVQQLINGDPAHPENKGIKGIIDTVATMTVDESKIKGIQAIASIMEVIGRIIPPIMNAIQSASQSVSAATLTPEQIRERTNLISTTINSISTAISSMFTTIIPSMISSLQTMPVNVKGLDSKVKAIKNVFDLIGVVAGITSSLQVTTTGTGGTTTTSVRSVLDTINPPLNLLIGLFSKSRIGNVPGYGETTENALKAVAAFTLPRGIAGKAQTIKTVFEAVKSLIEATASINSVATGAQTPIAARFLDIPLQNVDKVISGLTSGGISGGSGVNPLMNPRAFRGISIVKENIRGKGALLSSVRDSLQKITSAASGIGNIAAVDANAGARLRENNVSLASNTAILPILAEYFGSGADQSGGQISAITTSIREQAIAPMRSMVTAYNDFITELRNLSGGDGPLQVALTNLGTTLGGRQTLAVQNAAVNAQINVRVTIDSREIAASLRDTTNRTGTAANQKAFNTSAFNPTYTGYN